MNKRRTYGSGESQILSTLFTPSRDSERPLVGATLMTAFDPIADLRAALRALAN
jgi:hypothetical protein